VASFLLVLFSQRVFVKIESWVGSLWQSPFKPTMPSIGTTKLSCATLSPADQDKVRSTYSQVVRALSELAHETRFVTSYVLNVNATLADAQPIPLAEVEAEIFAYANANADANTCDICGDDPERVEMDKERGICVGCAGYLDEGIKYYTEDFAFASIHGKDALSLLVLRQRADNCRDTIALEAGSYDGYLGLHDASIEMKMLNKRAAECLARLPASFAPWWKDTWSYEKWCHVGGAREEANWHVEKSAPTVQRLAAMLTAAQHKVYDLKKMHSEMLANIERARNEDLEAVEARHHCEMDAATKTFKSMRADLERLSAENRGLRQQIEEDKQMVQRHLKEIAKEHAEVRAWEKEEVEQLKKENEALRKLVFPSLNLEATSSDVKLEPELAPKFTSSLAPQLPHPLAHPPLAEVVRDSPELKAEKTWKDGVDICYALTQKDYEDMIKTQWALPSVEVVEPDDRLDLMECPSPILPDQLMECGAAGCYDCPPVNTEAEVKAKRPNYNHPNWPSPTTKRFAKHLAKYAHKDPKAIKTHEKALEFIAKRAKVSVETLLNMSLKAYQLAHEPWSLVKDPWSPPNSLYFHCEL
jgi:hypothetical protein